MIRRQAFFCLSFLLVSGSGLFANLRAPVIVDRAGSELRAGGGAQIRVLSETLEFHCPESYKGKSDFELFAARVCDARVRYRVAAAGETVKLAFVFSGQGNVTWRHRDKVFTSAPVALKTGDRKVCSYCPDNMKEVMIAEQVVELVNGPNEIEIAYRQALSYRESGHSYFSDGKWTQSFTYELWPIAEWQWADDFHAELKFSIGARSGFLGVGYKDDKLECAVEINAAQTGLPLTMLPVSQDRRLATARIELKKKPQRLRCSYSAD